MPITDMHLRNTKPDKGKTMKEVNDGGGLFLLVNAKLKKVWRFRYTIDGKRNLLSLGPYPEISLDDARTRSADLRKLVKNGIDPATQRKEEKNAERAKAENTFESVAREWLAKQANIWEPRHGREVTKRLEANVFPVLGDRPIHEIEAPDLLDVARAIESRGAFDLAHRVVQVAGQIFRYGITTGRCKRDIAADLRGALTPHKKKHQSAVKPEELSGLLRAIGDYQGERGTRLALELLALTFVRTTELIGATWEEINLDAKVWIIPAERMKMKAEHVVPLSTQAVAIFGELKLLSGGSRYVFPGRNPSKPLSNNTLLFALYRLGFKGQMTGHGFRTVASTALHEAGWNSDAVERQLSHCERNAVKGAYNRAEHLPERRKMLQWWADYLDGIRNGAEVIPFRRAG